MTFSKWFGWSIAAVFSTNLLLISPVNVHQDAPGGAGQEETQDEGDKKSNRRNPRQIRRDKGEVGPPRMVGGRMSMDGNDTLKFYNKLEPLIGTFSLEGKSWRSPEVNPNTFTGEWVNAWALDGNYMRTDFVIHGLGGRPYFAMGMTYYNGRVRRYEADFYNSNGALRTARFGDFDEDEKILTMLSRNSRQSQDAEPGFKIIIEIVDEDKFIYSGWQQTSEKDKWWKSYEMVMTRNDTTVEIEEREEENDSAGS